MLKSNSNLKEVILVDQLKSQLLRTQAISTLDSCSTGKKLTTLRSLSELNQDSAVDRFHLIIPDVKSSDIVINRSDRPCEQVPYTYEEWCAYVRTLLSDQEYCFFLDKWSPRKCVLFVVTSLGIERFLVKMKRRVDRDSKAIIHYPVIKRSHVDFSKVEKLIERDSQFAAFINKVVDILQKTK